MDRSPFPPCGRAIGVPVTDLTETFPEGAPRAGPSKGQIAGHCSGGFCGGLCGGGGTVPSS
jgi:hypothetical protein